MGLRHPVDKLHNVKYVYNNLQNSESFMAVFWISWLVMKSPPVD